MNCVEAVQRCTLLIYYRDRVSITFVIDGYLSKSVDLLVIIRTVYDVT